MKRKWRWVQGPPPHTVTVSTFRRQRSSSFKTHSNPDSNCCNENGCYAQTTPKSESLTPPRPLSETPAVTQVLQPRQPSVHTLKKKKRPCVDKVLKNESLVDNPARRERGSSLQEVAVVSGWDFPISLVALLPKPRKYLPAAFSSCR